MDKELRKLQIKILEAFSKTAGDFALTGGTALELYYLKHRFSSDLDFFSPIYNLQEISSIAVESGKLAGVKVRLDKKFVAADRAKVRFYLVPAKSVKNPLKIDFVEDVLFNKPEIKLFNGVRVYDVEHIYLQKIFTMTGMAVSEDEAGREMLSGRMEVRDAVDIYYLSKKVKPLHMFMKTLPGNQRRGLVRWMHVFPRMEFRLNFLDIDIYDKTLTDKKVISHIENEINRFVREEAV